MSNRNQGVFAKLKTLCKCALLVREGNGTPLQDSCLENPEEPGRLQSMGSLRVVQDWATSLSLFSFLHWRRNGNPLQCSCLENPRDGGAWWAALYGVAQSRTRLKRLSSSSSSIISIRQKTVLVGQSKSLIRLIMSFGSLGDASSWEEKTRLNTHYTLLFSLLKHGRTCSFKHF